MNQGGEGEGRSAPPVPPDEPSHVADLLALMPAQLRHLVEEPAALMRHELAAFDKELLAFWAVIRPEDAQEWWSVIQAAEKTVIGLRYRRVETNLIKGRARAILRSHLGGRHVKRGGDVVPPHEVEAHNDALADRWASGDEEARPEVERLMRGVATEADIWAQATEVVTDQFGALRTLADRAEASVRRLLRDVGWLRNLKRICAKEGFPWGHAPRGPASFAGSAHPSSGTDEELAAVGA